MRKVGTVCVRAKLRCVDRPHGSVRYTGFECKEGSYVWGPAEVQESSRSAVVLHERHPLWSVDEFRPLLQEVLSLALEDPDGLVFLGRPVSGCNASVAVTHG